VLATCWRSPRRPTHRVVCATDPTSEQ